MTRSRSKLGRFKDNMRRNVLSYRYLKHNILMTALVVVIALCVFAVISFGEKADPLADELYANESVDVQQSEAVMMADDSVRLAFDAALLGDSTITANDTARVASSLGGAKDADSEALTEETTTEVKTSGTATILYDGVYVQEEESGESTVMCTVDSGTIFDLISYSDSWAYIKLFDGSTGYVRMDYVTLNGVS